jgi:hypothetical protein
MVVYECPYDRFLVIERRGSIATRDLRYVVLHTAGPGIAFGVYSTFEKAKAWFKKNEEQNWRP